MALLAPFCRDSNPDFNSVLLTSCSVWNLLPFTTHPHFVCTQRLTGDHQKKGLMLCDSRMPSFWLRLNGAGSNESVQKITDLFSSRHTEQRGLESLFCRIHDSVKGTAGYLRSYHCLARLHRRLSLRVLIGNPDESTCMLAPSRNPCRLSTNGKSYHAPLTGFETCIRITFQSPFPATVLSMQIWKKNSPKLP